MRTVAAMPDSLFGEYVVEFVDGDAVILFDVAICSQSPATRTVFVNRQGQTEFVVPDHAITRIYRRD